MAYGGRELPAFQKQSDQFYSALSGAGLAVERLVLPEHSHHSVLEELYRLDGKLVKVLAQLAS